MCGHVCLSQLWQWYFWTKNLGLFGQIGHWDDGEFEKIVLGKIVLLDKLGIGKIGFEADGHYDKCYS